MVDIHTKQDLVDFVKTYNKMTVFDIVNFHEEYLKIDLAKGEYSGL